MTETDAQRTRTGMLYALATFGAWGLNPFYFKAVDEIPALEVLAHRVVSVEPAAGPADLVGRAMALCRCWRRRHGGRSPP